MMNTKILANQKSEATWIKEQLLSSTPDLFALNHVVHKSIRLAVGYKQQVAHETAAIISRDKNDRAMLDEQRRLFPDSDQVLAKSILINVDKMDASDALIFMEERIAKKAGVLGRLVIMYGLSGTGKGTLSGMLSKKLAKGVHFSNGDIFRALTYLIRLESMEKESSFDYYLGMLTPERVESLLARIQYQSSANGVDYTIKKGPFESVMLSNIRNSALKTLSPLVPLVATRFPQEVIRFSKLVVDDMLNRGMDVVLEGREDTIYHYEADQQFELKLENKEIIGERRVVQRVLANAQKLQRQHLDVFPMLTLVNAFREVQSADNVVVLQV
jgi:cytidylate kinase